jgi:hypothetical protein
VAPNLQASGVPRWYESLRSDPADAAASAQAELIGEVSHAAGNLIHRMYYLTGVIERDPRQGNPADALAQIRESLESLHQLLNRAFALVRPVEVRPLPIAATDLLKSLVSRFGESSSDAPPALIAQLSGYDVGVDPAHLDRALNVLAEGLGLTRSGMNVAESAGWSVSVLRRSGEGALASDQLAVDLHVRASPDRTELLSEGVQRAVGLAMADRVFALFGWSLNIDSSTRPQCIRLLAPLHARSDGSAPR